MLALYGHPFSSYTWKALIALYTNETPFTFRMVDGDHPENCAVVQSASPLGKFPVLAEDGFKDVELFGPHAKPDGDFPNVPGHVAAHPRLFATFTAPSFGPVHRRRPAAKRNRPETAQQWSLHHRSLRNLAV